MARQDFVGIDLEQAHSFIERAMQWDNTVDDIVSLINQAELLSDIPSQSVLGLFDIASDGRQIAAAVRSAANQVASFRLPPIAGFAPGPWHPGIRSQLGFEPGLGDPAIAPHVLPGPVDLNAAIDAVRRDFPVSASASGRIVDDTTRSLEHVRRLWNRADQLQAAADATPDYWNYAQSSTDAQVHELRQGAWNQIVAIGQDPLVVLEALTNGQASSRDIARSLALQRANTLHNAAESIAGPGLGFERDQMRAEAAAILDELFLSSPTRTVVDRFADKLSPFDIAALAHYVSRGPDDAAAVLDSPNPMRVLQILGQGFVQAAAIDFVQHAPVQGQGALTISELQARLAYLERNHGDNTAEFDATVRTLSERIHAISGLTLVDADLDAAAIAERLGVPYTDVLAVRIADRVRATDGPPGLNDVHMEEIRREMQVFVVNRNTQVLHERAGIVTVTTPAELARLDAANRALDDPQAEADRLLAAMGAGASPFVAEALSAALPAGTTAAQAAHVARQMRRMIDSGHSLDDSFEAAVTGFIHGIDLVAAHQLAQDEGIDLPSAATLVVNAEMRGMTIDEYHAYKGILDSDTFRAIDAIRGGEPDGKISAFDMAHVLAHADDHPELAAVVQALWGSERLVARLDTARDYSQDVIGHQAFGRTELDDLTISRHDIEAFEAKQNLNFVLSGLVDQIDTASQGGTGDRHLSKQDFHAILASADELGLTPIEIAAVTTVINGRLYDQKWVERNRDSIAITAAVVAGVGIFVATGGVGATVSTGLISSTLAASGYGAAAAGWTTVGINSFTQEELGDGVVNNTIQGAVQGAFTAPGLASGGALFLGGSRLVGGATLASGVTGVVASGGADWAIDSVSEYDDIDRANVHADFAAAHLVLSGVALVPDFARDEAAKTVASHTANFATGFLPEPGEPLAELDAAS